MSLSSYPSSKRYDEGRSAGGGFSDHRKKERGEAEGKEASQRGEGGGGGVQASSLSLPSGQSVISTPGAGGAPSLAPPPGLRVASTVVTNVMRPVISTPLPIASKPRDAGTPPGPLPGPLPLDRKSLAPQHQQPQLLIGSGPGGGATAAGGGYYSSSSPNPGGVVTSLVLGGALSGQPAVQLIAPSPQAPPPQQQPHPSAAAPHSQTNGPLPLPLLQPQFLPSSSLAPPPGGKAVTQVQYILPTLPASTSHPKSPPQQLSQPPSIFNLPTAPPTHVSLANGKQAGSSPLTGYTSSSAVGVVSPGARGESCRAT